MCVIICGLELVLTQAEVHMLRLSNTILRRIVPRHVDMVPVAVNQKYIPDMVQTCARNRSGCDVDAVQQQPVGQRICLTNAGSLHQNGICIADLKCFIILRMRGQIIMQEQRLFEIRPVRIDLREDSVYDLLQRGLLLPDLRFLFLCQFVERLFAPQVIR